MGIHSQIVLNLTLGLYPHPSRRLLIRPRRRREHPTDERIHRFPDPVESACIHAGMVSGITVKLEQTRRDNKVLRGPFTVRAHAETGKGAC